jgi:acetyltransferase-like isoleucine patch superfamily enzyme
VSIGPFSEIAVLHKTPFSDKAGRLVIGDNVIIGTGANIRAAGGEIHIGNDSLIAQNVSIIGANHLMDHEGLYRQTRWDESRTGVYIGCNVWIGANVSLLPGIKIGNNSVIGAGSVVSKDVGDNEIWSGCAAIKKRNVEIGS